MNFYSIWRQKTDSIVFGDNQYNLGFSDLYVHDFIGDDGLLCKASSDKLGACIINSWRSYIIDIGTCIQFHKILLHRHSEKKPIIQV